MAHVVALSRSLLPHCVLSAMVLSRRGGDPLMSLGYDWREFNGSIIWRKSITKKKKKNKKINKKGQSGWLQMDG